MINSPPDSWTYTPALENLLFFYQCSEELLSFASPDSYRLPVCNCMTLCYEIRRIYGFLTENNQIDKYYSKYIPGIIDELIEGIENDKIIKNALGLRLDNVTTGLSSAKTNPQELMKWINIIYQSSPLSYHAAQCKTGIIENIRAGNNKLRILWNTQNYFIDLIILGYSAEYLYQTLIRYFDNRDSQIDSLDCIVDFLSRFDRTYHEYEFYVIADTYKLDNLSRISPEIGQDLSIQELSEATILEQKRKNGCLNKFYSIFEEKCKYGNSNIKMLSCKSEHLDPYSAFGVVKRAFDLAQCFEGYFKHKTERRIFFDILLVSDVNYVPIRLRRIVPNRPSLEQSIIDKRIDIVLGSKYCSVDVVFALLRAIDMHLDAINCKNEETMLRSFWTALEALFFVSDESEQKENAKNCLLYIIQKTYVLKQLRVVYAQLTTAITDNSFWENLGVADFMEFVKVFMMSSADENGFKRFTSALVNNPLLRSRIYWLRKELSDCKGIQKKIENHHQKVSWQIDRIYRTRNLSTHAGISMPYADEILFNVHNYFDYVVNYILCKLENKNYIYSISSMLFEAKVDNQIHIEYLKKNTSINEMNYLNALFGPDLSIVSFDFEAIIPTEVQEQDKLAE